MSILFLTILLIKIAVASAVVYAFCRYVLPYLIMLALAVLGVGLVFGLIALLAHLRGF